MNGARRSKFNAFGGSDGSREEGLLGCSNFKLWEGLQRNQLPAT